LPVLASTQLLSPKNAMRPVLSLVSLSQDSGISNALSIAVASRHTPPMSAIRCCMDRRGIMLGTPENTKENSRACCKRWSRAAGAD